MTIKIHKPHNSHNKNDKKSYTEKELTDIFYKLKNRSFSELPEKTKIMFKEMKVLGFASPFSLNLFINIERINTFNWPKEALVGLFAHELSHIVSYTQRSYFGRLLFIWRYRISKAAKRTVEHEADIIAINKGYKQELILTRTLAIRDYSQERIEKMKGVYFWPEELEKINSNSA